MNNTQDFFPQFLSNLSLIQNPITIITILFSLFLISILLFRTIWSKNKEEPKKLNEMSIDLESSDIAAIILKSTCNLTPLIGTFMGEIVNSLIPHQRMDRFQQYSEILGKNLESVENDLLITLLTNHNFIEFVEDSYYHAMRSATLKRMEQIAHIVVEGIRSNDLSFAERRHIFQILSQINDIEVIILGFFLYKRYGDSNEYRKQYSEIFEPEYFEYPEDSIQRDRSAILESYYGHLLGLGLLDQSYSIKERRNNKSEKSSVMLTHNGLRITRSGKLLLRNLGIECKDVDPDSDDYVDYLMD